MSFISNITQRAIVRVSAITPRFVAAQLVPRLLRPIRRPHLLAQTHERINLTGGIVAWRSNGQNPLSPLALFVHGFNGKHTQWNAIRDIVTAAGYRTVFLDPPAHGSSAGDRCDPVIFSAAISAAMNELGPVSLYLGHSVGAASGVMATSDCDPASAYVLVSSPMVMANSVAASARDAGFGPAAITAMLNQIGKSIGRHPSKVDLRPHLANMTAPALLIHDRQDRQVPFSETETMAAQWSDATFIQTTGLGHNRPLKDPDVLQDIMGFVQSLGQGPAR